VCRQEPVGDRLQGHLRPRLLKSPPCPPPHATRGPATDGSGNSRWRARGPGRPSVTWTLTRAPSERTGVTGDLWDLPSRPRAVSSSTGFSLGSTGQLGILQMAPLFGRASWSWRICPQPQGRRCFRCDPLRFPGDGTFRDVPFIWDFSLSLSIASKPHCFHCHGVVSFLNVQIHTFTATILKCIVPLTLEATFFKKKYCFIYYIILYIFFFAIRR
jgi:hypothetical protein